jgi:hypothetical protein
MRRDGLLARLKADGVCLEEGTLSGWLYEVLEPHVEELVDRGADAPRVRSQGRVVKKP